MRAGISRSRAACAIAAPWLPPEAATTPAAGTGRRSRFAKAPRALKDPDCCSSSSLSTSVKAGRPKAGPSTSTTGVKRMCGRISASVAAICSRPTLEGLTEHPAGLGDALLVAAVEGPFFYPLRPDQAQARKDLEVLVRAGLRHAELVGDEEAAHAVLDQVAVDLGWEVGPRLLQPVEDGQPPVVRQRRRHAARNHLVTMLSDKERVKRKRPGLSRGFAPARGRLRQRRSARDHVDEDDRVVLLRQVLLGAQERGRHRVGKPEVGVLRAGEEADGKRDLRMQREQVGAELAARGADVDALLPGDLQRDRARLRGEGDESQLATRVFLLELVSQLRDGQRGRVSGERPARREIQLLAPSLGLALVEMRHGRLAGAEVDLDPPKVRLAAALDPAEALLSELALEGQPGVLDGDAAVLEAPDRVHDEPVALELLGELAIGDELAGLIAHRGKAVQVGLRIPQRHAPGR